MLPKKCLLKLVKLFYSLHVAEKNMNPNCLQLQLLLQPLLRQISGRHHEWSVFYHSFLCKMDNSQLTMRNALLYWELYCFKWYFVVFLVCISDDTHSPKHANIQRQYRYTDFARELFFSILIVSHCVQSSGGVFLPFLFLFCLTLMP